MNDTQAELGKLLEKNHKLTNGVWHTQFGNIYGLNLLAATTNGTSGIAIYKGQKVYFYQRLSKFFVESYH